MLMPTKYIAMATACLMTFLMVGLRVACSDTAETTPQPPDGFNRVVIPTGHYPASIAVADVNRDGKPDIIVANTEDETVSVLLGDGKGHFASAPGSPFACGKVPNDIAVTDMNGDGNPDLIIANTGTPYITILLGDGKGGFATSPHSPFATQSYPHVHGVVAADFMGNGKPAVITDSWGHDQILMIPSDGNGNLILPGKLFNTGKRPYQRLRSADFNGDGKPDVVTTDLDLNAVTILLGDGKGGLIEAPGSPFAAGAAPWSVAIGDINGDGKLDLAILPYAPDVRDPKDLGVTVLLGDSKGGFTKMRGSPFSLAGCRGPDRVAIGDVNGDGVSDIVVSCGQNHRLMLYLGTKDGTFQVSTLDVQTGWSGLAVADLLGDGKKEIIVSNGALDDDPKNQPETITIFFSQQRH
jgi:VCBS repeat protein